MITSGVATPSTASNNIAVVITIPASKPASSPAKIAFVLVTAVADFIGFALQGNQIASFGKTNYPSNSTVCLPTDSHLIRAIA
jgi:hypothetical protein